MSLYPRAARSACRGGGGELGRIENDHIEGTIFIAEFSQKLKDIAFEEVCFINRRDHSMQYFLLQERALLQKSRLR